MLVVPLFNINKETYRNISKFFTKINNKFLIEFCLESLNITKEEEILFIINFYDCNNLNLNKILKKIYKNFIINIIKKSNSILDTLYQSKELIKDDEKLIIFAPPLLILNLFSILIHLIKKNVLYYYLNQIIQIIVMLK